MRIVTQQEPLRRALEHVASVVSPNGILQHLLIEANGDSARLIGTSEEMSLSVSLVCTVEEAGVVALPASLLRDYVANLPAGSVTLSSRGETSLVVEAVDGARAEVSGIPPADFPRPGAVRYRGVDLPSEVVRQAADLVSFAASGDRARPMLAGVFIEVSDGAIRMSATDGYRLARVEIPSSDGAGTLRAILPTRALSVLKRFADEGEVIRLGTPERGEGRIGFLLGAAEFTVRLIAGTYPDLNRAIPSTVPTTALVDRAAMAKIVQRVVLLANDETRRVEMEVGTAQITFGGKSNGRGSAQDALSAEVSGEGLPIAVNGDYLLRILGKVPGDRVRIGFAGKGRQISISPAAGVLPEGWIAQYVLMPLREAA